MAVGYYSNQRSPQRRGVHIEIGADGLRLFDECGLLITFWSYDGLDLLHRPSKYEPFELGHERDKSARLVSVDTDLLAVLSDVCPEIYEQTGYPRLRALMRIFVILLAVGTVASLFFASVELLANRLALVIPSAWEQKLGGQVAKRLLVESGECTTPEGTKALDRLTGRISSVVQVPWPLRVRVSADPRIDSVAVSGGEIVIFRGLIERTQSSDELAGIIAHEVAHSALRHPVAGMIRDSGPIFLLSSLQDGLSELAFSSASYKQTLMKLHYSTEEEAYASELAGEILVAAKINPHAVSGMVDRLKSEGDVVTPFIARHSSANPSATAEVLPAGMSGAGLSAPEWAAIRGLCQKPEAASVGSAG